MKPTLPIMPFSRASLVAAGGVVVLSVFFLAWWMSGWWMSHRDQLGSSSRPPSRSITSIRSTQASECQQLWNAQRTDQLIDTLQRWLESPAHPVSEVVTWLRHLPSGEARDRLVSAIATDLPISERLALALVTTHPDIHRDLLTEALAEWAGKDASAAIAWLSHHRDDRAYQPAQTAIVHAWASDHPRDAAAYAASAMDPGIDQDRAVIGVVQRWVQSEPQASATWVESLPTGPLQLTASEELARIWAESDVATAAKWLDALPPSAMRDQALSAFARQIAPDAPSEALRWSALIADARLRAACLESLRELRGKSNER